VGPLKPAEKQLFLETFMTRENNLSGTAQRNAILKDLDPELQEVAKNVKDKVCRANRGLLLIAHEVGSLLLEVKAKKGLSDDDTVEKIAVYSGVNGGQRTLESWICLADVFDLPFLKKEMAVPMNSGNLLSLSHFIQLSTIAREKHADFLKRIRKESLSVADLSTAIETEGLRSVKKPGGGRKPKRPTSPVTGLHELAKRTVNLSKYAAMLTGDVFPKIADMPPDMVDGRFLEQIEAAQAATANMMKALRPMLKGLEEGKARVQRILDLRERRQRDKAAERELDAALA
jgi:hypothetical protein